MAESSGSKSISIRFKLTVALGLFSTISLGALAWVIMIEARSALLAETTSRGILIGTTLATNGSRALLVKDRLTASKLLNDAMKNEGVEYAILVDTKGIVFAEGGEDLRHVGKSYTELSGETTQASGLPPGASLEIVREGEKGLLAFTLPVWVGKTRIGTAYVGLSQEKIEAVVGGMTRTVGLLVAAFLLLGMIGALVLAAVMVRPVNRLAKGAAAIGEGNLDTRIKVSSGDEIGKLAMSFNDMAANLKTAQAVMIKKNLMERDLSIANQIQARLIPKTIPFIKGYEVTGYYQAANEVGGDYYDVLDLENNRFGLVVADVSGKGVPGSLGMAMTRSEFRVNAFNSKDVSTPLIKTNKAIFPDIRGELFVSMAYSVLDTGTHRLECASAGHNPAFLIRNGEVEKIKPKGLAIGVVDDKRYKALEQTVELHKGDLFVLYTDGITEAMDMHDNEYEEARLIAYLIREAKAPLNQLRDGLLADIKKFTGEAPQHDDMTLLLLRRQA